MDDTPLHQNTMPSLPPKLKWSSFCVPAATRSPVGLVRGDRGPFFHSSLKPQPGLAQHRWGSEPAGRISKTVCMKARCKGPVPRHRKGTDKSINHVLVLIRPFTQKCSSENLWLVLKTEEPGATSLWTWLESCGQWVCKLSVSEAGNQMHHFKIRGNS